MTRDEIRIAEPHPKGWQGRFANVPVDALLASFFNKRFEFYGRRIRLMPNQASDSSSSAGQRANAVRAAEELRVFASMPEEDYGGYDYNVALAEYGIVSTTNESLFTQAALDRYHPYVWSYPMAPDNQLAALGNWACARLAGAAASHAGGLERGRPRIFGVILEQQFLEQNITVEPLTREFARCNTTPKVVIRRSIKESQDTQTDDNTVLQMKDAGVTSVFCLCRAVEMAELFASATQQGYFPEWLHSSYGLTDLNNWMHAFGQSVPQQSANLFGLSLIPKQVPPDTDPSSVALREIDPSVAIEGDGLFFYSLHLNYRSLLLLASGIQMAGPKLTPETFAKALGRTTFPNPVTELRAGAVGFAGDHSMTDDAAEIWWSNTAKGPYTDDYGATCYVDAGVRRAVTTFPRGSDPFFDGNCQT